MFNEYELKLIEWLKTFKNRYDLERKYRRVYVGLRINFRHLLYEAFGAGLKRRTLEECKKDASTYNTRNEYKKLNLRSYMSALKNGWLEKCCEHMKCARNKKKVRCSNGEVYESIGEASRQLGLNKKRVSEVPKQKRKSYRGYTFVYVDEE